MITNGKSFSEIAEVDNLSTRRVQDIANLALIAPDILDAITLGKKPDGLSTDYLIKTASPPSGQNSARNSARYDGDSLQTRTARVANRNFGAKTTLKAFMIASHSTPLCAKRWETRDNNRANKQSQKSGTCLAGAPGFEPGTYGFGDRRSTN